MNQSGLSKTKKIIIISLMSVVVVLLAVAALVLFLNKDDSRTIMIYMNGTDLETNNYGATSEIKGLDPSNIDFEKYHVLLYTGGTKVWHNFIESNENAIYELTKDGFVKIESYDTKSMGDPNTLSEFLTYGYTNYPAGNYDLMIWDHGAASMGAIHDEKNGDDSLYLFEMETALKNSPFNGKNKLQNVIFETCLNGTLEVATVFAPYANYLVASEEITYSSPFISELTFINSIGETKTSYDFAQAFVDGYSDKISKMDAIYGIDNTSTYSIIDLNKVPELNKKLDTLYESLDVSTNYATIARARANLYQFAVNTSEYYGYDTVDLYEFVESVEDLNPRKAKEIMNFIKNKVVLYSWSRTSHGNGLSIYIPFNYKKGEASAHFKVFDMTSLSDTYKNFIKDIDDAKNSTTYAYTYKLDKNTATVEKKDDTKEFKMKLTDDQVENYSRSKYIVFKKESDGLFTPIYAATDTKLTDDGYVTTNLTNNLISIVDEETNERSFFLMIKTAASDDNIKRYIAPLDMWSVAKDENGLPTFSSAEINLSIDKNNKVSIDKVYTTGTSDDMFTTTGPVVDINDYAQLMFYITRYKIIDENGNYTPDWEYQGTSWRFSVNKGKYHFEASSLDEGDYYCSFVIYDLQNKPNYSNLIKIN